MHSRGLCKSSILWVLMRRNCATGQRKDLKADSLYCGLQAIFPISWEWHYTKKLHALLSTHKPKLQRVLFFSWNKKVIYEVWALTWKKTKPASMWACKILVPSQWCGLQEEKMERTSCPPLLGLSCPKYLWYCGLFMSLSGLGFTIIHPGRWRFAGWM